MERIVFLDRDGTLNEEVHYLHRREDLKLIPGVPQALRLLKQAGYRLVVVTNQAGVARGYYKESDVEALHRYMNRVLEREEMCIRDRSQFDQFVGGLPAPYPGAAVD